MGLIVTILKAFLKTFRCVNRLHSAQNFCAESLPSEIVIVYETLHTVALYIQSLITL